MLGNSQDRIRPEMGHREVLLEEHVWGSTPVRSSEGGKPEEERREEKQALRGQDRLRGQYICGIVGHSDLWLCQGHEGQSLVGLGRWEREGLEGDREAHRGSPVCWGILKVWVLVLDSYPKLVRSACGETKQWWWSLSTGEISKSGRPRGFCFLDR